MWDGGMDVNASLLVGLLASVLDSDFVLETFFLWGRLWENVGKRDVTWESRVEEGR